MDNNWRPYMPYLVLAVICCLASVGIVFIAFVAMGHLGGTDHSLMAVAAMAFAPAAVGVGIAAHMPHGRE
jgi:Flp pilus assembly protein protease CpaA